MASTYNFTVRAEDDQGAFADRDFSIIVKNTSVDRYMVVDANNAYTSPDMVNWTQRNDQGGLSVAYGGGKWLITTAFTTASTSSTYAMKYRLSTDGINFSNHDFDTGPTYPRSLIHPPVWDNDSQMWWVSTTQASSTIGGSPYTQKFYKSSDGENWILAAHIQDGTNSTRLGTEFASTPSFYNGMVYYGGRSGNTGYLEIPSNSVDLQLTSSDIKTHAIPATIPTTGRIFHTPFRVNDIWIRPTQAAGLNFIYSSNMQDWYAGNLDGVPRTVASSIRFGEISYINGVVVCGPSRNAPSANIYPSVIVSRNGRDWKVVNISDASPINPNFAKVSILPTKGKILICSPNGVGSKMYETSDLFDTLTPVETLGDLPVSSLAAIATIR